jgi:putative flavoprotein involved in K+ transport
MKYRSIATVVIGAGHNGLAMSRCLAELGIEHIVLERGEVANTWRHERWDSLRLLTPNWLSRLPGYAYGQEHPGADPDGFMGMAETVGFITGYALATEAPVMTQTTVERVEPADDGYTVITNQGVWRCRSVVMANGAFSIPKVPKVRNLQKTGSAGRWGCAGRRRVRQRDPAGQRDSPIRPSGDASDR